MSVQANERARFGGRFTKRQIAIAAAALAVLIVLALLLTQLLGGNPLGGKDVPSGPDFVVPEPGANAAAYFEGGEPELVLSSGEALQRYGIMEQDDEDIGTLPGGTGVASYGSDWIAYVSFRAAETTEPTTEPIVNVHNVRTESNERLGVGFAPVWMSSGARIAYLVPTQPYTCTDAGCQGDYSVEVHDMTSGEETTLLEAGQWSLIAWAGDRLLVGDGVAQTVVSVSVDGDETTIDATPDSILAASPDGQWIVSTSREGAALIPLAEEGGLAGDAEIVDMEGKKAQSAFFSHDSSAVAVVAAPTKVTGGTAALPEVVTFSVEDPKATILNDSLGVTTDVLWSVDNDAVVFAQVIDQKKGIQQARYCPVSEGAICRTLISYTQDVMLLRME